MKPLILLTGGTGAAANGTPTYALNKNYASNVSRAGGLPILAVDDYKAEEYADLADGLLLSGGKDVATEEYGQTQNYDFILTDLTRDTQELALIKAFMDRKKPIFGICRGIQILNVALGGTLIQDIPDQLGGEHNRGVNHLLTIKKDSILGGYFGESMMINSYHHQGLDKLGEGLIATAWADANGHELVEAVEHESLPVWAVQWHPERMTGEVTNPEHCVDSFPIFEHFVNQCKK